MNDKINSRVKYNGINTDVELAAQSLTRNSDPFKNELVSFNKELAKWKSNKKSAKHDLANLQERKRPYQPENHTSEVAWWSFGVSAVIVGALFLLHCLVWVLNLVFNISWETWHWTVKAFLCCGAFSSLLTFVVYVIYQRKYSSYLYELDLYENYIQTRDGLKEEIAESDRQIKSLCDEIDTLNSVRIKVLGTAVKMFTGIPIHVDMIQSVDYKSLKNDLFDLLDLKSMIETAGDEATTSKNMRSYFDEKLKFFYTYSMKYEFIDERIYEEFKYKYDLSVKREDTNVLREVRDTQNSQGVKAIQRLDSLMDAMYDNTLEPYIDEMREIEEMDTRGLLFTSKSKLTEKTKAMGKIFDAARAEYNELASVSKSVMYALNYTRACSYRNIYLGSELINYFRSNAGGANLIAMHDDMNNYDYNYIGTSVYVPRSSDGGFLGRLEKYERDSVWNGLDLENASPTLAMAATVDTIINVAKSALTSLENHVDSVRRHEGKQYQLVKELGKMVADYPQLQGKMLRAIELTKSIVKANDGFMAIYEPLKERVFDSDNNNITKDELLKLALAIKEYKRIADSKII